MSLTSCKEVQKDGQEKHPGLVTNVPRKAAARDDVCALLNRLSNKYPFLQKDATELAGDIHYGRLSALQVIEAAVDVATHANNYLNFLAFDSFSAARQRAKEIDEFLVERRDQFRFEFERAIDSKEHCVEALPPFFGVPFISKCSFEHVGCEYSQGIHAHKDRRGERDAPLIQVLESKLGFIRIGGGNVSEACMWYETHNTIHGWTLNTFDPRCSPGGSSGGSVVGVSCGAVPIGLTADVGGSTRIPCTFQGQFGHKPSGGLLSNVGSHHEHCHKALHRICQPGVAARSVRDLLAIYEGMRDWQIGELTLSHVQNNSGLSKNNSRELATEWKEKLTEVSVDYIPRTLEVQKMMDPQFSFPYWTEDGMIESIYHLPSNDQIQFGLNETPVVMSSSETSRINPGGAIPVVVLAHYAEHRWKLQTLEMNAYETVHDSHAQVNEDRDAKVSDGIDTKNVLRSLRIFVLEPTYGFCKWSAWFDMLCLWFFLFWKALLTRFGLTNSTPLASECGHHRQREVMSTSPGILGSLGLMRPGKEHMESLKVARDIFERDFPKTHISPEHSSHRGLAEKEQDSNTIPEKTMIQVENVSFYELGADWWFEMWGARLHMNENESFAAELGLENKLSVILYEIVKTGASQICRRLPFIPQVSASKFTFPALGLSLLELLFDQPERQEGLNAAALKLRKAIKNNYLTEKRHLMARKTKGQSGNAENLEFDCCFVDGSVILLPTLPFSAPRHGHSVLKSLGTPYTSIWNCLEIPATTVPVSSAIGLSDMPIGLQIVGSSDNVCLAVAAYLESNGFAQAWGAREFKKPTTKRKKFK